MEAGSGVGENPGSFTVTLGKAVADPMLEFTVTDHAAVPKSVSVPETTVFKVWESPQLFPAETVPPAEQGDEPDPNAAPFTPAISVESPVTAP